MSSLTLHPASPWFAASAAIADGRAVDWPGLDREATTDEERELLSQLRVVAEIAALHRTFDDGAVAGPARVVGRIEPASWGAALEFERPPAGQRWGNYELLEQVGSGAFGEVYRARDLTLDREVAVKLFREREGAGQSAERMLAEGRTLAQVRHANVVTIHAAESHDDRAGLCMEFVRGLTLEAYVQVHGPLEPRDVAFIGQDLCRALAAVHSAGLVHRDVKARNVMREDGGRIVLMDFGAGQPQGDPDRVSPRLTGTPLYLAPEVLAGREASVKSDVYALGVLLFYLATGRYPVDGASLAEVREAHRLGTRTALADVRPGLPDVLLRAVERALDPNPSTRVATAGQLHVLLAEAVASQSGHGVTRGRRRYWLVGMATTAFIGAVFAAREPIRSELVGRPAVTLQSMAFVPFANRSPAAQFDYLGTGLADVLNAAFGRSASMEVRTPRSGPALASMSPVDVGRSLGVEAVVSGEYDVRGDQVRVDYTVTDVARTMTLAGGTIEFPVNDLLEGRARLTERIGQIVRMRETDVRSSVARLPTEQNAALEDFLRGTYEVDRFWQQPSTERLQLAERHLLVALEKDPAFTLALVTLAKLRWVGAFYGYGEGGRELDAASVAADRALAVDPNLGEAHAAKALVDFQRGALDDARTRLRMAASLSPNAALVHYAAGFYFMGRGLALESAAAFERAQQLDPNLVRRELGFAYQYSGDLERAAAQYRDDLSRHPGDVSTLKSLAFVLLGLHRTEEAARLILDAEQLSPADRGVRLLSVYLAVQRGDASGVSAWLSRSRADYWSDGGSCANVAAVLAAAGRHDEALDWLRRAGTLAMRSFAYVSDSPYFTALRGSPDFAAYLSTLEQEWRVAAREEERDSLLSAPAPR